MSQRDKRVRSLAILAGLGFVYIICMLPNGRRNGDGMNTAEYYTQKMDEALDSILTSRFMAGTVVFQKGTIEEFSEKDDLEDELESLKTRLSVYSETPDEIKTDALREREAGLRRQIDSIGTVLSSMTDGASSSRSRVRRVSFRQPDGDCYTAFQKIDGKCTGSTLMNLVLLDQ